MNSLPVTVSDPASEEKRLAVLNQYCILDTPPEKDFNQLAKLASQICATPVVWISFADRFRHWLKARIGFEPHEIPRGHAICDDSLLQTNLFKIENTLADPRTAQHPLVTGPPYLRFFAAHPLHTPDGFAIGALCVADREPRRLLDSQIDALQTLANQVVAQLELRRKVSQLHSIISDQQKTEQALRHSEAFYLSLVSHLPQHIFRKDLNGRFTFANAQFGSALGQAPEFIVGKTDFDFFPPSLARKYQRDDLRVIQTLQPYETVEAHQTPQGEKRYVQVVKTPITDSTGQALGIQGIFWDVTERKRIEHALAYERDLLRAMLDTLPDSIFFKDIGSRFLKCSRSLASELGLNHPDEAVGMTDFDFFAHDYAQSTFDDEQEIIRTGQPNLAQPELEILKDGRRKWVLTTKIPLRNKSGIIIGTFGISKDISDLKEAECQLAQARDSALESARLKSEFLANMSHEIRTPMNAIIGMAELILQTNLTPEQRGFAETVRSSANALLDIINDILDFSKIEAGKLSIQSIDFNLREVIESTIDLLSERAHARGLELLLAIDPTIPSALRGDPGRLRQILTNLLGNAIKFTIQGEVTIRVISEPTPQSQSRSQILLHFIVSDTGIGIPPEMHPRIFEAFAQADGSTTRHFGGTGLGLAISKQLVELMNGSIGFESVPSLGSQFWFKLPFEINTAAPSAVPLPDLAPMRVLVVDDNKSSAQLLQETLTNWRLHSDAVSSAHYALDALITAAAQNDPYTVALLDLSMPDMDGLELAKTIRSNHSIAHIPLLLLTRVGLPINPAILQQTGISACLIKPIKSWRLHSALSWLSANKPDPLPVIISSTEPADLTAHPVPSNPAVRVLVAEDNRINQSVVYHQLKKLGYAADLVSNGRQAVQKSQESNYQIILMDCQMPDLDGYDATLQIRQSLRSSAQAQPQPYIIALTANTLDGDREKCLAAGMDDYIRKPVRLLQLAAALQRGLQCVLHPPIPPALTLDPNTLHQIGRLQSPNAIDPLSEVISLFLEDSPLLLNHIRSAIEKQSASELHTASHSLKGSAANLGGLRVSQLSAELENSARRLDWIQASRVFPLLQSEFARLAVLLKNKISPISPDTDDPPPRQQFSL